MFKKILIAEDFEMTNHGLVTMLNQTLHEPILHKAMYCDDAYLQFRKALHDNVPFETLITDISFKKTHRITRLESGVELIDAIRKLDPNIKIIVYSKEDRPVRVQTLFDQHKIDAFVCKGQESKKELIAALQNAFENKTYCSRVITNQLHTNNTIELDDFDMLLLKELANGLTKKEIVTLLKQRKINPNSESTIDKRVSKLFDSFQAKNTTHLIAMIKDLGLL